MTDERRDFLPIEPGGGSVCVIGDIDSVLLERLTDLFESVVVMDWDDARLADLRAKPPGQIEIMSIEVGKPRFPAARFDLILIFWALNHLGDIRSWITATIERLNSRGRIVIIDRIERPLLPSQEITTNLHDLRIDIEARCGIDLMPDGSPDRLIELLHDDIRFRIGLKVFTDPDLLTDSRHRLIDAQRIVSDLEERLKRLESHSTEGGQGCPPHPVRTLSARLDAIRSSLAQTEPGTPPFFMLRAIRQSTSLMPDEEAAAVSLDGDAGIEEAGAQRQTRQTSDVRLRKQDTGRIDGMPLCMQGADEIPASVYLPQSGISSSEPFERLLTYGPDSLSNQELMAIIINGLPPGNREAIDPEQLTQRLVKEYGDKAISEERNPGRLAEMLGIAQSIAALIVTVFELGRRYYAEPRHREPTIRSPDDCFNYLRDMGALKKEHLRGLYLNVQSRLIHDEVISIGTLSRSVVHPREVFSPALEHSAHSVILAHNHPSGDLNPSEADVTVTRQLAQAGRIMGIELIDHLIIGADSYVSLKQKRIL